MSDIFFTFRSHYLSTIAHVQYLVLEGGAPVFKQHIKFTALLLNQILYTGLPTIKGLSPLLL